jgi:hypothetical protein
MEGRDQINTEQRNQRIDSMLFFINKIPFKYYIFNYITLRK